VKNTITMLLYLSNVFQVNFYILDNEKTNLE